MKTTGQLNTPSSKLAVGFRKVASTAFAVKNALKSQSGEKAAEWAG